jgi:propionate CoA-transferase
MLVEQGRLHIEREGHTRKFVAEVEHRTYSGRHARQRGQPALYITERCVLRLGDEGLELIEIAPGIDLERDVLAQMDFMPLMRQAPRLMDARIFAPGPMGLRDDLLHLPLQRRFSYDALQGIFFANFEGHVVRDSADVEAIRDAVQRCLAPLAHKVPAIIDYDNFHVAPQVLDEYSQMVSELAQRHYTQVTRYTTSAFLRVKLGEALRQRGVAPHIFESAEQARAHLADDDAGG